MLSEVLRQELFGRKLLATDLDGTLLRPDLTVSDFTRRTIAQAVAGGIHIAFVTGRPPRWMGPVAQETGHAGTAICANGAVLLNLTEEIVLARTLIDTRAATEVALGLRDTFGTDVHFAVERVAPGSRAAAAPEEFALEAGYRGRLPLPDNAPQRPLRELLALPDVVKMLARVEQREPRAFRDKADELVAGRLEVTHSATDALLEFGPAGVTKATGLAGLVDALGLTSADVVAVGDMPNDVAMLDWAGIGLAVLDGHAEARSAASHAVPGPIDDGVGLILRAMLTGR